MMKHGLGTDFRDTIEAKLALYGRYRLVTGCGIVAYVFLSQIWVLQEKHV